MSNRDRRRKARAARELEATLKAKRAAEELASHAKAESDKITNATETAVEREEKEPPIGVVTPEPVKGKGVELSRSEIRQQMTSLTWKDVNRAPLQKTVSEDGALIDPTPSECNIMEEATIILGQAFRHKSIKIRLRAAQIANQFARTVQADDHKKLMAELRPTVINQNLNVDARQDNRRVLLIIPDNGRDPAPVQKMQESTK